MWIAAHLLLPTTFALEVLRADKESAWWGRRTHIPPRTGAGDVQGAAQCWGAVEAERHAEPRGGLQSESHLRKEQRQA